MAPSPPTDICNFPTLSRPEFEEACHLLDTRYRRATLGPLRKEWKLNVRRALDLSFWSDNDGYSTYIEIIRPLEGEADLPLDLGGCSISETAPESLTSAQDAEMMETEESDKAWQPTQSRIIILVLPAPRARQDHGFVAYEIHLHPTYRVPCLWFTLHGLAADEPAFNIDTVFRRLVPDRHKASIREGMNICAISTDHNPVTGLPSFFIHPCRTADVMAQIPCNMRDYLVSWLGVFGSGVSLSVPIEVVLQ